MKQREDENEKVGTKQRTRKEVKANTTKNKGNKFSREMREGYKTRAYSLWKAARKELLQRR